MALSRTINNATFAQCLGNSIVGGAGGSVTNQMSNGNFLDDEAVVGLHDGLDGVEERDDRDDEEESESGRGGTSGSSPCDLEEDDLHDRDKEGELEDLDAFPQDNQRDE